MEKKYCSAAREYLEQLTLNHQVEVTAGTFINDTAVCGYVIMTDVLGKHCVNLEMVVHGYVVPYF